MAKIDIQTNIEVPETINIRLVREDYLDTSNTFRIIFEVCIGLFFAFTGAMIELMSDGKTIPALDWFIFAVLLAGSITFLWLSAKNYKKAKPPTVAK
jgi:hypothetical protein